MKDILNTILTATVIPTATERLQELTATAAEAVKAVEAVVDGLYATHSVEEGGWAMRLEEGIAPLKAAIATAAPVETGDDFGPAEEHGRLDDSIFDRVLDQVEADTTAAPIGAWLDSAQEAEAGTVEMDEDADEARREVLLRQIFSGPSPAMMAAAIAASGDPREPTRSPRGGACVMRALWRAARRSSRGWAWSCRSVPKARSVLA